jgi:uncharacterized protein HemX
MKSGRIAVTVLALVFAGFAFAQQQGKEEKKPATTVKVETKAKARDAAKEKKSMDACAADSSAAKGGHDCCGKK